MLGVSKDVFNDVVNIFYYFLILIIYMWGFVFKFDLKEIKFKLETCQNLHKILKDEFKIVII